MPVLNVTGVPPPVIEHQIDGCGARVLRIDAFTESYCCPLIILITFIIRAARCAAHLRGPEANADELVHDQYSHTGAESASSPATCSNNSLAVGRSLLTTGLHSMARSLLQWRCCDRVHLFVALLASTTCCASRNMYYVRTSNNTRERNALSVISVARLKALKA